MALNKNAAAQTPAFETPDDDVAVADQAAATRAAAQERLQAAANKHAAEKPAEEQTSTSTAVATPKQLGGQVAKAQPMVNPLETLKDAFPVQWDTLRSLKLSSGNLVDQQTGKALGDEFGLEILSFQDQWVIGTGSDDPKDKDASKDKVRYSDDGKVTTKGEDCAQYLANLKATGYPNAKMEQRVVIAGALFYMTDKGKKACPDLVDSLVQCSLPPTSRATFQRYQMDQAYRIGRGVIEAEGANRVKLVCEPVNKNNRDWTLANFSRWVDAA